MYTRLSTKKKSLKRHHSFSFNILCIKLAGPSPHSDVNEPKCNFRGKKDQR